MKLTSRGRRQVTNSLFQGSYWVYRNLSLRVREGGIEGNQLPFTVLQQFLPLLVNQLREYASRNPDWFRFQNIDENHIDLIEPVTVRTDVSPTTWWCSSCHNLYSGPIGQVGIQNGRCPSCRQRALVQLASVFMCPQCHNIEPVEKVSCPHCGDSRSVILEGHGGRRREYRWKCTRHTNFEVYVHKQCSRDGARMALKSTGGRLYNTARLPNVQTFSAGNRNIREIGNLRFVPSRATVIDVVVGRIPISDLNAYYRGEETSPIEPFVNPNTGNYIGLVSRLETDAIVISALQPQYRDNLTLHSLKHALLNAAPAVTGLTQDEFGAYLQIQSGQLVFYDNVHGGTGGCRLLSDRRLNRWLQVARELAECHQVQCEDACRGCLFLPSRICHQGNSSLDRHRVLEVIPGNINP
jgi:hypothetical protein